MKFRGDIQGIRAVAVLLVIFHHFFPSNLTGGYIGVDIFFVISGYLITDILISQSNLTAPKLLIEFYARRIRRILPLAILGILAGSLFAQLLLGVIFGADSRRDGFFALLFIANWHFNDLAVDYFSSGLPPSIFQHYWSLAVEEQFYLFWPILIALTRKLRFGPMLAIGSITLTSLTYSILQVEKGSGTAFFATSTRIWELGIGALLALSGIKVANNRISFGALVILLFLGAYFDASTGFPGLPALLVVVMTSLLLVTSEGNRTLSHKTLRYLGDISFSLYIWHWVIFQGASLYFGYEPTLLLKLFLLALTFAVSALSSKVVENPIRYSTKLRTRPKLTILLGMLSLALSIILIKLPEVLS